MNYNNIIFTILILIVFVLSIALDEGEDEGQWKWKPSYSSLDTRPFGTKAVQERFKDLFPDQENTIIRKSLYEVLKEYEIQNFNYVLINQAFKPLHFDAEALLEYVDGGGTVFVSAQVFEGLLADTLKIETEQMNESAKDSVSLSFVDKNLAEAKSFTFMKGTANYYFSKFDKANSVVLAHNQAKKPVLLRLDFGEGVFYLSSTPLAYTNYNLLWQSDNYQFIEGTFAYLPQQDIYWDEYYKVGRDESKSPFRFLMSRRSLRTGFYLGLFTVFILVIFEARRKQRIIPVVEPLKNDTLEFVTVVGQMYFQSKNHSHIAQKKTCLFREYLRRQHFMHEIMPSEEGIEKLATKTNTPKEDVQKLFNLMSVIEKKATITEKDLQKLSKLMNQFKFGQMA
jgi:hypothetical protein